MIEKKFGEILRTHVHPSKMTFGRHFSDYRVGYDEKLLNKYLPPTSGVLTGDGVLLSTLGKVLPEDTVEALESTEFIGVYGRVVEGGRGFTCLQYLYVWDYQAVPAHEADYEPIFIYLDKYSHYSIYDLVHYCTRRLDLKPTGADRPRLQMVPGWHSFLPNHSATKVSIDKELEINPLSDQHLKAWWSIPDIHAQFKIRDFMNDPFQLEAPGHFLSNPDEDAKTICCVFLEIERALREYDNPREGIIEGIKRAFTKCVGIFALYRLGAFIVLLNEMNSVGLVKMSMPLRAGLSIATIGEMLRDGFLSVTKAGAQFFAGMKSSDKDEEGSGSSVKDRFV